MQRFEAEILLSQKFGFNSFYDTQWEIIKGVFDNKKTLVVQKTGFGKSLCYQFPATQLNGVTIVFTPLISLMRDQVRSLKKLGISAKSINSEESIEDNLSTLDEAKSGDLKLLFIAPERIENIDFMEKVQDPSFSNIIKLIVIDEGHCISQWGHDFRPSYRRIIDIVRLIHSVPILITTATATKFVQKDIQKQIGGGFKLNMGSLVRNNFHLYVSITKSYDEKLILLAEQIKSQEGTGIVYVGTRTDSLIVSRWLRSININAAYYNSRLDADSRKEIETNFMNNKYKVIVATNALGMGIDKPDIRFVIHYQIPQSLIHYYQEIGRAGRDGKGSNIILIYNNSKNKEGVSIDDELPLSFIKNSRPKESKYLKVINSLTQQGLTEQPIMRKNNLKQGEVRTIIADLVDQNIVKRRIEEVVDRNGRVKYTRKIIELQSSYSNFDYSLFDELKKHRIKEYEEMKNYIHFEKSRMQFVCNYLGDDFVLNTHENSNFKGGCDNTNLSKIKYHINTELNTQLIDFKENFFPILELSTRSYVLLDGKRIYFKCLINNEFEITINNHVVGESKMKSVNHMNIPDDIKMKINSKIQDQCYKYKLTNGFAASYYGMSDIGKVIHRCKYENGGDFPNHLLGLVLRVIRKKVKVKFDFIMYVPPTESGDLVKNFAVKIASILKLPISHDLYKLNETLPQKILRNSLLKRDNVKSVFGYKRNDIYGKKILLIDDICDSGATLKSIGQMLSEKGANLIVPIVIARTVAGDIIDID